jgi:signal transduction histidine kinase
MFLRNASTGKVHKVGALRATRTFPHDAGAKIAVIEDDDDFRTTLDHLLRDVGYHVSTFASATTALRAMDRGFVPDLILLDLKMPGMNGWQFRIAQKQRPALSAVPVVALSADASPAAAAIDADAYVGKPVEFERLSAVLAQVLTVSQRARSLEAAQCEDRIQGLARLVASISHEVNNPLTYLLASLDLASVSLDALQAERDAASREKCLATLEQSVLGARNGTLRIAAAIEWLSTFVSTEQSATGTVDPLHAIEAAVRLAHLLVRERAELLCELGVLSRVRIDEAHLAQVLLTLLANAAQAIAPGAPKENQVRIRTSQQDGFAVIEVEDSGVGIEPSLLPRIFDAHFTATRPGAGMGVGLASARNIIAACGGSLTVTSTSGRGSTFRLALPGADVGRPRAQAKDPAFCLHGPPQRVLVVDDEAMIGDFVAASLQDHIVRASHDPVQALSEIADLPYDLVLCDLMMPDLDGLEFYSALCKGRPDLRQAFVLMTAATPTPEVEAFLSKHQIPLLRKPFAVSDLRIYIAARAHARTARH